MSDYYASFYADLPPEHLTLCGSLPPVANQDPSDPGFASYPAVTHHGYDADSLSRNVLPIATNLVPQASQTYAATSRREHKSNRRNGEIATVEEEYWANGRPVNEFFKHGNFTLNLPVRAHTDAPILHKQAIYANTISRIEGATGTFIQKYDALRLRLEDLCPNAELTVESATAALSDFNNPAYTVTQLIVMDLAYADIDIGNGPNLPNTITNNGFFLRFTLTFNPRKCAIHPALGIDANGFPAASSRQVFTELPRENDKIHPDITYNMLRQRSAHKDILQAYKNAAVPFTILAAARHSDIPDSNVYDTWFSETIAKVKFSALKQAGRSYIGRMDGLKSLNDRLKAVRMKAWNHKFKRHTFLSVETLYQTFNVHLLEVDPKNPPPDIVDLATSFFDALTFELREALRDNIPPKIGNDYLSNLARLKQMKKLAEDEERKVNRIATIAQSHNRGRQPPRITNPHNTNPSNGTTFAAYPHPPNTTQHPSLPPQSSDVPRPTTANPYVVEYITLVSQAEEALQVASGTRYPRECWGCGDPGHTFGKNCPKHQDLACIQRYNQKMKEFVESRRNKKRNSGYYGNHGYFTEKIYNAITMIGQHETEPSVRRTLLAELADDVTTHTNSSNTDTQAIKKSKMGTNDMKGRTFVTYLTGASTFERPGPLEFSINKLQPYLYFPIGLDQDNTAHLRGLYDTGGCCNMGWLQYHLEIAKQFPHIVKQVICLQSIREEPFSIGGIDGSVLITYLIEYFLPYKDGQGENYTLLIGLVDDFPLNTLFGLPFITKAQLILHLHKLAVTSAVFEAEFEVKMERNQRYPLEEVAQTQQNNTRVFQTAMDDESE